MNSWNPYMHHQMPYNENFHIDEDWDVPRNVNESAQNIELSTMMENVPIPTMPSAYPQMAPMITMPTAYPHTAPMMPMDCGCYYPSGHHYPMFTCPESGVPWTTPMFPMPSMAGTMPSMTSPVGETAMPMMGPNMPAPTTSYPAAPSMHGHFTPSPSPMMESGYTPYYPYR
ncbi:hypothetical protein B0I26_10186 [Anoxybacillus vitaminiphilus]|uniref:Uncharacterized protein n=1 Tax=Paranoxybacillus vitaminiphilus TaxID=581036 RepID=A0A327YRF9_9BACL|nr:hypothetical protein [Anoxybacillus vitaminiphilus]RAK23132.1 hypothetical protein B0I26_10186 [Anoxybacillus vitaminiphilus]